jgi:hypothetical protein
MWKSLAVGLLLSVVPAVAQLGLDPGRVPKGFITGKDWLKLSKTEQELYAMGVIDGLDLSSAIDPAGRGVTWINRCVAGMDSQRVGALLKAELQSHPSEQSLLMVHRSMYEALWKACRD